ncbi:MAG: hypothetical protein N2C14_21655 [Planctomycetales bacterium]
MSQQKNQLAPLAVESPQQPSFIDYNPATTFFVGLENIQDVVAGLVDGALLRKGKPYRLFGAIEKANSPDSDSESSSRGAKSPYVEAFLDAVMNKRASQFLEALDLDLDDHVAREQAINLLRSDLDDNEDAPGEGSGDLSLPPDGNVLLGAETEKKDKAFYDVQESWVQNSRSDWGTAALDSHRFFKDKNIATKQVIAALEATDDSDSTQIKGLLVAGVSQDAVKHFAVVSQETSPEDGVGVTLATPLRDLGLRYVTSLSAHPRSYSIKHHAILNPAFAVLDCLRTGDF